MIANYIRFRNLFYSAVITQYFIKENISKKIKLYSFLVQVLANEL